MRATWDDSRRGFGMLLLEKSGHRYFKASGALQQALLILSLRPTIFCQKLQSAPSVFQGVRIATLVFPSS